MKEQVLMQNQTETKLSKEFMELVNINFQKWNEALKTLDAKEVTKLYSKDAQLIPTLSNPRKGREEIKDYFENHFLPKHPAGEIASVDGKFTNENSYYVGGEYDFEVGPDNLRENVPARYTFIYEKNDEGEWEIIHHHSSKDPEQGASKN